jgi:lipocalin
MDFLKNMFFNTYQNEEEKSNRNIVYSHTFFDINQLRGSWVELARTSNSLQQSDCGDIIHSFKTNESNQIYHRVKYGRKKIHHILDIDNNSKDVTFSDVNNNYFGSSNKAHLIGIYDASLNLITQPDSQERAYCMLAQGSDRLWILAQENRKLEGDIHMMNFAKQLGYKIEEKPKDDELIILWNFKNFPNGCVLNINRGDSIRFKSTDGKLHTVSQADEFWNPCLNTIIDQPPSSLYFNRALKIGEPGVYYLVCPIDQNHKTMRLRVNVR